MNVTHLPGSVTVRVYDQNGQHVADRVNLPVWDAVRYVRAAAAVGFQCEVNGRQVLPA